MEVVLVIVIALAASAVCLVLREISDGVQKIGEQIEVTRIKTYPDLRERK